MSLTRNKKRSYCSRMSYYWMNMKRSRTKNSKMKTNKLRRKMSYWSMRMTNSWS
jgi:hypothetical protein